MYARTVPVSPAEQRSVALCALCGLETRADAGEVAARMGRRGKGPLMEFYIWNANSDRNAAHLLLGMDNRFVVEREILLEPFREHREVKRRLYAGLILPRVREIVGVTGLEHRVQRTDAYSRLLGTVFGDALDAFQIAEAELLKSLEKRYAGNASCDVGDVAHEATAGLKAKLEAGYLEMTPYKRQVADLILGQLREEERGILMLSTGFEIDGHNVQRPYSREEIARYMKISGLDVRRKEEVAKRRLNHPLRRGVLQQVRGLASDSDVRAYLAEVAEVDIRRHLAYFGYASDELDLSVRARHAVWVLGRRTIAELDSAFFESIPIIKNCGKVTVAEIHEKLAAWKRSEVPSFRVN
ncbi:hypothetical protein J4419_04740 [Candidatus Woesearchaeota archaeon]|nr:hypothetical protein [Candidatus Woesearchaeota archaeon]